MRGYSKLTYSGRPLDRVLWQNLSTHCYPALLTDAVKTGVPFDVVDIWVNWLSSTFPTDNYHNAGFEAILFGCLTQWTARWRPAQLAVWRSFSHCLLPSPPTPPPPLPIVLFFLHGSAFARLNLLFYHSYYEPQKKKHSKTTASYAGYYTAFLKSLLVSAHRVFHFSSVASPKRSLQKSPKKSLQCSLACNLKISLRVLSQHVLQIAKQIAKQREHEKI